MSSSPTETTLIDVTMPQMGVSVAEGTVICTNEKAYSPYDLISTPQAWEMGILHSVPADKADFARNALAAYQYAYATHDTLPNPFDGVGIELH